MKIKVKTIRDQNDVRYIGLSFKYDLTIISTIKRLPSAAFTYTYRCWYLPWSREAWQSFVNLELSYSLADPDDDLLQFIESKGQTSKLTISGTTTDVRSKCENTGIVPSLKGPISASLQPDKEAADIRCQPGTVNITWSARGFQVEMAYSHMNVQFLRTLRGSWWNSRRKRWMVKTSIENLEALQDNFNCWDSACYNVLLDLIHKEIRPLQLELYITPEFTDRIAIKLKGYHCNPSYLKGVSNRCYDKALKRWIIPKNEDLIARIIEHYEGLGATVVNRLPVDDKHYQVARSGLETKRSQLITKFSAKHRHILIQYTDALIRMRYSWRTVRSYTPAFYKFLEYLAPLAIQQATEKEVNAYLAGLASRKISESFLHQTINAIKFYFAKVSFVPNFQLDQVQRPKNGRYLPTHTQYW